MLIRLILFVKKILTPIWFVLIVSQVHAFNLDSLLIASIGGPEAYDSLRHLSSSRVEGSINLNGQQGQFLQYFVPPTSFYLEVRFDEFRLVQAYDGQTAWQIDLNGRMSELDGFEKRELLKNVYFESFSYLLPKRLAGGKEYRGETVRDGQTYHVVAFFPLNNDTVVAYYDAQSGLSKLLVSRLDNLNTVTTIDNYQEVSGILVPFNSKATFEGVPLFTEFTAETVVLNDYVDTTIFSMPVTVQVDYFFPEGARYVEIPFEYHAGHIKLPVTVNGRRRLSFILDSGSSANIIHKPLADMLNLPIAGTLPARGLGGFENVELVKTDSLSIGRLTLYNQLAGSLDLSLLGRTSVQDENWGGVLGYDFLSRFPMMINYQESTLIVYNPDRFEPPQGGTEVDFYLTMLVPTVRGELNGIPGEFIIDLGNAFGLIIHHQFAKLHNLEEKLDDLRDNREMFGGIGGSVAGKTAYAATFKVGNILIQSLRVMLPDSTSGLTGSEELAGNIGNMILENFRLLLDYENGRLVFYDADT